MRFRLQFDAREIRALSRRYQYEDDLRVQSLGQAAKERGWFTRAEFIEIGEWKTPRIRSRAALNTDRDVEDATRAALLTTDILGAMEPLRRLHGVDWAVGSVLLHLAHRDAFPILDFRALQAFGIQRGRWSGPSLWRGYVEATRSLAKSEGLDMRTVDRALWQWSKEQARAVVAPTARGRGQPTDVRRRPSTDVDVVVLGCVSSKQRGAAPARELYVSPLWEKRRAYAEASGKPWVIYSAEHGILDPDEIIDWYDVALMRLPRAQQRAKGAHAASQLRTRFGDLREKTFEIHAGAAYVDSLRELLTRAGARLKVPLAGLSIGYQLQWYGLQAAGDE
jgi:hypothetical protein